MKKPMVYIMRAVCGSSRYYKIGITRNLRKRTKEIATGCPVPPKVIWRSEATNAAPGLERRIHGCLSKRRSHLEWFLFDSDEQAVEAVRKSISGELDVDKGSKTKVSLSQAEDGCILIDSKTLNLIKTNECGISRAKHRLILKEYGIDTDQGGWARKLKGRKMNKDQAILLLHPGKREHRFSFNDILLAIEASYE